MKKDLHATLLFQFRVTLALFLKFITLGFAARSVTAIDCDNCESLTQTPEITSKEIP